MIVDYGERFLDFELVKKVRGESHRRQGHSLCLSAEMVWVDCFGVGVEIYYQQITKAWYRGGKCF